MKRLIKNKHGFTLIEVIIVVMVVAIIGIVGYDVWSAHHKRSTDIASNTAASNISWKTFNNGHVSFKYPSNWMVQDQGAQYNGQYVLAVNVDSPLIKPTISLPGVTTLTQYTKITSIGIEYSIGNLGAGSEQFITDPDSPYRSCNNPVNAEFFSSCKILAISPLSITNSTARLFITADPTTNLVISDDNAAQVGDNNFNLGIFIGNAPLALSGNIIFNQYTNWPSHDCTGSDGNPCSGPEGDGTSQSVLTSLPAIKNFETTVVYREFIQSIDSITVDQ